MLIVHDPRCAAYGSALRPEQPARILATVPLLKEKHPHWAWFNPQETEVADETLLLAHSEAHLRRLAVDADFDADTPALPEIAAHARRAVAAALAATRHAWSDHHPAFSLMRPPGHHASRDQAMGFCYLNQVAIAALWARRDLEAERVAVWDFDAHHGNGTEAILRGRPGFLYVSVHQHPCYPGTGTESAGNFRNWPVLPRTPAAEHMDILRRSWDAVIAFRPDLILVSAGFDAYEGDPITGLSLRAADFRELGSWLGHAACPAAAVLEGGYSVDLPLLIEAFLAGWSPEKHGASPRNASA